MPKTRSPLRFKHSDVTRAVKAALKSGLIIIRTEIEPDGKIILVHSGERMTSPVTELDQWRAKRDARSA